MWRTRTAGASNARNNNSGGAVTRAGRSRSRLSEMPGE